MSDSAYDLVIVGGGPGGYVAAIRARQLGLRTALVEREHLGGICLNWGCIPTKALLRTAEINDLLHHLDEHGFSAADVHFDLAKVVARSRAVAKRLSNGVRHLMKKNGVDVVDGHARLRGPGRLVVERDGARCARAHRAPHHPRHRRAARARCRDSSRTGSWCGPTRKRWCPSGCRARCWSSAPARSASSSRASITTWAPR